MSIDKEKQIEKMAKDIHEELETENIPYYECDFMAQRLVKKGWVKPDKDSVVLTQDEWNDESHLAQRFGYDLGSKEMAEKIINPLLDIEVIDEDYKQFFLDVCGKLEELADKHGVEIKE